MAIYTTKIFRDKSDEYNTPLHAWKDIKQYIPKDKIIWEPFYSNGASGTHLKKLGFTVIHKNVDFFQNNLGQIVVSNPPYSKTKEVLTRLKFLDKPFILILPVSKITTQYFRGIFKNDIQIIIPKKRIHFEKLVDGIVPKGWKSSCYFDTFYYCYRIGLDNDITWL